MTDYFDAFKPHLLPVVGGGHSKKYLIGTLQVIKQRHVQDYLTPWPLDVILGLGFYINMSLRLRK